jgi:hypothetical protein
MLSSNARKHSLGNDVYTSVAMHGTEWMLLAVIGDGNIACHVRDQSAGVSGCWTHHEYCLGPVRWQANDRLVLET